MVASRTAEDLFGTLLSDLGYDADQRESVKTFDRLAVAAPDVGTVVAFTDRAVKDISTAAIVCAPRDHLTYGLKFASMIAAPSVLSADARTVRLHALNGEMLAEWDLGSPPPAPIVRDLAPGAILSAKLGMRQLSLFPTAADELRRVRSLGTSVVSAVVSEVLLLAQSRPSDRPVAASGNGSLRDASRLVVSAMTVAAYRDKLATGRSLTAEFVTGVVARALPTTFAWLLDDRNATSAVAEMARHLCESVDFAPLDQVILAHVYEETVASQLDSGTFYTPPSVARTLVDSIPFELLPPHRRGVLDPACGSGSLLYAARKRLSGLQPGGWTTEQKHADLVRHLWGRDQDPFAVGLAQLALVLTDLAAGNGWRIVQEKVEEAVPGPLTQGVVLMNPPWDSPVSRQLRGGERADYFINWMLDRIAPESAYGLVLPSSWLSKEQSAVTRNRLTAETDVTDVVRLPDKLFGSRTRPCLVVGMVPGRPNSSRFYIQHRVWAGGRQRFQSDGTVAESTVLGRLPTSLASGPVADWVSSRTLEHLSTIARVRIGSQPKGGLGARFTDAQGTISFLPTLRGIQPYSDVGRGSLVLRQSEQFEHLADDEAAGPKLIVVAIGEPANPTPMKVVFDRLGVHFVNSAWGITAPSYDLDVLGSIIGSRFISAFVDDLSPGVNVRKGVIESIPILPASKYAELAVKIRRIIDRGTGPTASKRRAIEEAVRSSYGVPPSLAEAIDRRFDSGGVPNYPSVTQSGGQGERILGVVDSVSNREITIRSNAPDWPASGISIALPLGFKGSMLWAGCGFTAEQPRTGEAEVRVRYARFTHDPIGYRTLTSDPNEQASM